MTRNSIILKLTRFGAAILAVSAAFAVLAVVIPIAVGMGETQLRALQRAKDTQKAVESSRPLVAPVDQLPVAPVNLAAIKSPKTVAPAGFETRYAGMVPFDEKYECQSAESSPEAARGDILRSKVYLWLRTSADVSEAKYLLARDGEFKSKIFVPRESYWLRIEGGNAKNMCLDVFALKDGEHVGQSGCFMSFNRDFPEITVYSDSGKPEARGVCKAIS